MEPTRSGRTRRYAIGAIALAMAAIPTLAGERWLHIRVEEGGSRPQTVRVNLPFSLLESVAPLIREEHLGGKGKIELGKGRFDEADLRAVLEAVRSAEEGDYVTVESSDEKVRVAKSGDNLLIKVDQPRNKSEKVVVKVPLVVIEALLSGPAGQLDFGAALKALRNHGDCELVAVDDGETVVRMWVDGHNESR